jgi:hypothetical protein
MKYRRLLIIGAGVLTAVLAFALWPADDEPVYQDKTLAQWAESYVVQGNMAGSYLWRTDTNGPAALALRAMSAQALPHLLRWIQYQPGPRRPKWSAFVRKLPRGIARSRVFQGLDVEKYTQRAINAAEVFSALRDLGAPAIPELTRLMNDWSGSDVSERAIDALVRIGPPALPATAQILPPHPDRDFMLKGISQWNKPGMDLTASLPLLLPWLEMEDPELSTLAANFLGQTRFQPETTIPALVAALANQGPQVRAALIDALGQFGPAATNAIPRLTAALQDPDAAVRQSATNALQKIAPDSAAKISPSDTFSSQIKR